MEHKLTRTDTMDSSAVLSPVRLCKYVNERCAGSWVGLQKRGLAIVSTSEASVSAGLVCNEMTRATLRLLGEVHAPEEGLEAGVGS